MLSKCTAGSDLQPSESSTVCKNKRCWCFEACNNAALPFSVKCPSCLYIINLNLLCILSTCAVWSLTNKSLCVYTSYVSLKLNRQTYLYIHSLLIISLNARPLLIPRPLCACSGAYQCLLIGLVYPQCAAVASLDPVYMYKHAQTCTILCVEPVTTQQGATKTHWALSCDLPLVWVCILCTWSVQH